MSSHPKVAGLYLIERGSGSEIATSNLTPGLRFYEEESVSAEDVEYRVWNPFRSKLAATILKDVPLPFLHPDIRILYLGTSTGTTVSHLSDLVGPGGSIYGVEFSARVMREFLERVARVRSNVFPIYADARDPETYLDLVPRLDLVYCDVAQPDQTSIAVRNCRTFLRSGGWLLLAVKSRSIDVTRPPSEIYREEAEKLRNAGFAVEGTVELEPFSKDHVMIVAQQG